VGRPVRRDQDRHAERGDKLTATPPDAGDGSIKAVPLRRPGQWIAAIVVVVLLALFVYGAASNDSYQWATYRQYLFDKRISTGAWVTIQVTFWAMLLGIVLGSILAVMRLTSNKVLQSVSWLYLWVFRGTPVYVQLVFWGLFTTLYPHMALGVPFGPRFVHIDLQGVDAAFFFACLGLGLNEAAYMAEIVRAGISSVGEGQMEAATALGMPWSLTMRRIVLPQAMRVIIPPTGNELISMLKTTSLVIALPLSSELYNQANQISGVIFRPIPLLLVAATWYLAITSVLMVGQYFLEKRFARGTSRKLTTRQLEALAKALGKGASGDGGGGGV
jgi:polar amino acid transport system permease protein